MKAYYAEVKYDDYIGLTALEVRETAKLYLVDSERPIVGGGSFCKRIPKDSPYFHLTVDSAIAYIQHEVKDFVERKQQQIAKLQESEAKLLAAYEEYKKRKGGENAS